MILNKSIGSLDTGFSSIPASSSTEDLEEGPEKSDRTNERCGAVSVEETANGPGLLGQQRKYAGHIGVEKANGE